MIRKVLGEIILNYLGQGHLPGDTSERAVHIFHFTSALRTIHGNPALPHNVARHLPPPGRKVERKENIQILPGRRTERAGGG
jgi:hypothetical protein